MGHPQSKIFGLTPSLRLKYGFARDDAAYKFVVNLRFVMAS
jgi:hypothetical protein